ncbi:hypothetical protein FBD94_12960 [Pedobacter hiemivivus]|uniref:Outer membrane protein beta-barrel domain-containing protein n=1 Tax=Pedobacter hiemivivus TaxID=2530454 RepID=A0A4U1GFD3_9SPHI|nr:hypothetical protein EZ444_25165 [Pedobacter hiemivivus]TKC61523.1 hypothetical protein FBD94_12960 [Pedobacter hiemivivus]
MALTAKSQTNVIQTKATFFEGVIVAGYVDQGAYINCAGPAIKFSKKPLAILVGLLPSLRIKKDKVATGATQNSVITPNLGAGITATYKHLAIQVPVYYNAKTSTKDGKWNPGIGIGYKF